MSTEVTGFPRRPLTVDDISSPPDDGHRYEMIIETVFVAPAPDDVHQRAAARLHHRLSPACPDGAEVHAAPYDVVLAENTLIRPDLVVVPIGDGSKPDLPNPLILVVEVTSHHTRDLDVMKMDPLAEAGCPHYWIVDPDEPSITAWRLDGDEYVETAHAEGDEVFRVAEPVSVELRPRDLVD